MIHQLAPPICKILPPVVTASNAAASSTYIFIDGNFKDNTMIDIYQFFINMTDQSVIFIMAGG